MDFWINLGWSFKIPASNRPPSRYITVYANFNTRDVSNLPVSITLIKNEEREKEFSSNKLYIYEVILRLKFHGLFNKEKKKKKKIFTFAIDSHPSYKTCQSVGILASDRAYIHI